MAHFITGLLMDKFFMVSFMYHSTKISEIIEKPGI